MNIWLNAAQIFMRFRLGLVVAFASGCFAAYTDPKLDSKIWNIMWIVIFMSTISNTRRWIESGLADECNRSSLPLWKSHLLQIFQVSWVGIFSFWLIGLGYLVTSALISPQMMFLNALPHMAQAKLWVALVAVVIFLFVYPLNIILWAHTAGRLPKSFSSIIILLFFVSLMAPESWIEFNFSMFPYRALASPVFKNLSWAVLAASASTLFNLVIWFFISLNIRRPFFYIKWYNRPSYALLVTPTLFAFSHNTYGAEHHFTFGVFVLMILSLILEGRLENPKTHPRISRSTLKRWTMALSAFSVLSIIEALALGVSIVNGDDWFPVLRSYSVTLLELMTILFLMEAGFVAINKWTRWVFWFALIPQAVLGIMSVPYLVTGSSAGKSYEVFMWGFSYLFENKVLTTVDNSILAWAWGYHVLQFLASYFLWRYCFRQANQFYTKLETATPQKLKEA